MFNNHKKHFTSSTKHQAKPTVEALEERNLLTTTPVFVNDTWHLVTDVDNSNSVTAGDIVDDRNDNGGTPTMQFTLDDGTGNVGNAFGTVTTGTFTGAVAAADTITEAIGGTDVGGTVNVLAGTYTENVILNKQVNLLGAQNGVDARGRADIFDDSVSSIITAGSGILLELRSGSAMSVIDGFTFDGGFRGIESTTGPINEIEIRNNHIENQTSGGSAVFLNDSGTDITVDQNVFVGSADTSTIFFLDTDNFDGFQFTNNVLRDATAANGLFVDGNHNVGASANRAPLIQGNLIQNNAVGMNLGTRAFEFGEISENTYDGNTFDGLQGGIQNTMITRNTFSNNGRHGLALTSFGNMGADRGAQNTTISENFFFNNTTTDVLFSSTQAAGTISTNTLFNNSLLSTTAVSYDGTETINASANWWGSNDETDVRNSIGGTGAANVDSTPFLDSSTDTDTNTAGFQGDLSILNVTTLGAQSGATGRIEEGVETVDATGTVNVLAGTYNENVDVDKSVTIQARGGEATVQGTSSALTATSGTINVIGMTFTTATDNPTILVNGGNLVIRQSFIEESTGFDQFAFSITGGVLDLGTTADPGSNSISLSGAGNFISDDSAAAGGAFPWELGTNDEVLIGITDNTGGPRTADDVIGNIADVNQIFVAQTGSTSRQAIIRFTLTRDGNNNITGGTRDYISISTLEHNGVGLKALDQFDADTLYYTLEEGGGDDDGLIGRATSLAATPLSHSPVADLSNVRTGGFSGYDPEGIAIDRTNNFLYVMTDDGPNADVAQYTINQDLTLTLNWVTTVETVVGNGNDGIVLSDGRVAVVAGSDSVNIYAVSQDGNTVTNLLGGAVGDGGVDRDTPQDLLEFNGFLYLLWESGIVDAFDLSNPSTTPDASIDLDAIIGPRNFGGLGITNDGNLLVSTRSVGGVGGEVFAFNNPTGGGPTTISASGNFWGTTDENAIAAGMNGLVDFTPYLDSGTDTEAGTPGFQGDFSVLNVTTLGEQVGLVERIQEAVNQVDAGGTVNLNAGTYTENVNVNKDVTIDGDDTDTSTVDGGAAGSVFTVTGGTTASLIDLNIQNGDATNGGGVLNMGDLSILDTTIQNNNATNDGGGLWSNGTVSVSNSTISNNTADEQGGGAYIDGTGTFRNVTITGNNADTDGNGGNQEGGGIFHASPTTLFLYNSIVAGNTQGTADDDNDISGLAAEAASSNNVLGDADSSGGLTHGNNGNIVGNEGTGTLSITSILNVNLADNGGPTPTHALITGSVAIDAGNNVQALAPDGATPLDFDQRGDGFPRINNDIVDIGAFEAAAPKAPTHPEIAINIQNAAHVLVGDYDNDGEDELGVIESNGDFRVAEVDENGFLSISTWGTSPISQNWRTLVTANVNGDDFDDIVGFTNDGRWIVGISDGTSFDITVSDPSGFIGNQFFSFHVGNFTGGPEDDIAGVGTGGTVFVFEWNGVDDFDSSIWAQWEPTSGWFSFHAGDFDNDNTDDLLGVGTSGSVWVGISNGVDTFDRGAMPWAQIGSTSNFVQFLVGNFNENDPADDLVGIRPNGQWVLAQSNGGPGFTTSIWGNWASIGPNPLVSIHKANIDGQGPDDIIALAPGSSLFHGQVNGDMIDNPVFRSSKPNSFLATYTGDFDGDGRDDAASSTNTGTLWLDITDTDQLPAVNPADRDHIVTGDFNNDGDAELAGVDADGNFWTANVVNDEFVTMDQAQFNINSPVRAVVSGNFDNAGPDDVAVYTQDGRILVARDTGGGFVVEQWANPGFAGSGFDSFYSGDFNGDNMGDVLGFGTGGTVYVFESTGTNFTTSIWAQWEPASQWDSFHVADFNFDDRDDFIGIGTAGTVWVGISTDNNPNQDTFNRSVWAQLGSTNNWHSFIVGNFDGSNPGVTDLLGMRQNGSWLLASSNGAGFDITDPYGQWQPGSFWAEFYPARRGNDGLNDVIGLAFGSTVWQGFANGVLQDPVQITENVNALNQLYIDDFDDDGQDEIGALTLSRGLFYHDPD